MIDAQRLERLRKLFANCEDTLYLRGSFVRGDSCPNDIDISAYNSVGKIKMSNPPAEFEGIPINYGGIAIKDLERYFINCPRGASSLMEMLPISIAHPEVPEIIARQRNEFLSVRIPEYLLFLLVEEGVHCKLPYVHIVDVYYSLKRRSGGKRTISRIIWAIKALHYESFSNLSHEEVLREMMLIYNIPDSVMESFLFVLRSTCVDIDIWSLHASRVEAWRNKIFTPLILHYILQYIPETVVRYAISASGPNSDVVDLCYAFNFCKNLSGQQKWILLFALSSNQKMPEKYLLEIWDEYASKAQYRNFIRNLIRNPSFPESSIDPIYLNDELILKAYEMRAFFSR